MGNERMTEGFIRRLLDPRNFLYLALLTSLLLFYISNILRINELSGENEVLKEKIALLQSINAPLVLQLQAQESIQSIAQKAEDAGLLQSVEPAVYITY